MPRRDDEFEYDDRPRRRRPQDDEDQDRPSRSRRPRDDEDEEGERPRSRRRRDFEDENRERRPLKKKSSLPLILGILAGVFVICCGGGGLGLYFLGDRIFGEVADRTESANNMKRIGVAMHQHQDVQGFIPNNSYAPDGRPLLSWRVHILPYLGEEGLYRQFNLNEPWDGPTNRKLISQMPKIYGTAEMRKTSGEGKTYYRGFSHQGAIFEKPRAKGLPPNRLTFGNILDGMTNTIAVVEAGEAVEWTKPDDIDFGPGRPLPPLGAGRKGDQVIVLMLDGSFRIVRKTAPESAWRGASTYNGGEVVFLD
jgi:hypothetical protein